MWANITQNSKKNVAVIVVVPIVFGIMIGLGIQTTDAQLTGPFYSEQHNPPVLLKQTVQYGWDIEEDDSVGEIDRNDPVAPSIRYVNIQNYRASEYHLDPVTYKIRYGLTGGQQDLTDIQIRVVTDLGEWNFDISSLDAYATIKNVARVKALDPDSITGEIIGYTASGIDRIKYYNP